MNWLDAVILVAILWFTFAAFQAGFIREIVTLVAIVLGIVLAGLFYDDLADDVLPFINDQETLAPIIAFGIIFLAVALAGQLLAMVLKPTVAMLQLGLFDSFAGAAFGFVKGLIIIQIFLIVFITFPKWGLDDAIEDSLFGSLTVEMVDKVPAVIRILPDRFEDRVSRFADRL